MQTTHKSNSSFMNKLMCCIALNVTTNSRYGLKCTEDQLKDLWIVSNIVYKQIFKVLYNHMKTFWRKNFFQQDMVKGLNIQ